MKELKKFSQPSENKKLPNTKVNKKNTSYKSCKNMKE